MFEFIDTFFVQSLLITINYNNSQSIFSRTLPPWLPRTRPIRVSALRLPKTESESYITTDGQSASLSSNKDPSGAYDQIFIMSVTDLLTWGALPNERMGLPFIIAAGPRQRSNSQVRVPRDS
jgi:hypothetical protein